MRKGLKITLGVIGGFILIGVIANSGNKTETGTASAASATVTKAAPTLTAPTYNSPAPTTAAPVVQSGPLTTFDEGIYEVGVDIAPGKYKTPGPTDEMFSSGSCYFEIGDGSGSITGIDKNDNISGPGIFTVKKGKELKTSGNCVWTLQQ